MKKITLIIHLVLVSFVFSFSLWAQLKLPDKPSTYVSDFAGLLSPAQRQRLEQQLAELEKNDSNQVLVVTVPELQGLPIEDFAIALAEKWKPGQADRDNGVILLVAPKERKVRIEVGYGLEGALPDATAKRIIEGEIIPVFRQGDFSSGIANGVEAIIAATQGEYQSRAKQSYGDPAKSWSKWLGLILAISFLIFLKALHRQRRSFGHDRRGWHALPFFLAALGSLGGRSGGSSGSSWGGGGFSGGGGSFGGGGASGSW